MLSLTRQLSRRLPRVTTVRALSAAAAETTTSTASRYAVVDHSQAYEESMRGMHGKQLQLAQLEGFGKDNAAFDPFLEEEMEEQVEEDDDDDDCDEEDEEEEDGDEEQVSVYNNDGSLKWKKSQLAAFRAGAPAGGMFAIVELAGSQHKVTKDDLLVLNRLKPVDQYKVGSVHTLKDVLMVSSSHKTMVGMPYVSGAQVEVMVEEITQDEKVIVFKKRRRKNSKRKNGHRRDLTLLRVLDVRPPEEQRDHKHLLREDPQP